MPSLFLDTNILIDLVARSRPAHEDAARLVAAALAQGWTLHASVASFKDVYFVYERHHGTEAQARQAIKLLRRIAEPVALDAGMLDDALESDEPDLEDGMVRAAAEALGDTAIVSRDSAAFAGSTIPRLDACGAYALVVDAAGA